MKKDNKLSWGITFLFFGILFLLKTFNIIPTTIGQYLFDLANFPIIVGIIFFIFHKTKNIGWALILVGLFMRFDAIYRYFDILPTYVWSLTLIAIGAVLIWGLKGGK